MKRMVLGICAVLCFGLAFAQPTWATVPPPKPPVIDTDRAAPDTVDLSAQQGADTDTSGRDTGISVPGPWTDYRYPATACRSNAGVDDDGISTSGTADFLCGAATNCPDGGDIRYFAYSRKMGANNKPLDGAKWESAGTVCRGADDPAPGPPQITEEMIIDAAREVAPKTRIRVEPGTKTYVNVPTNFSTDDETETRTVTILGLDLQVTFDPEGFQWKFGDAEAGSGPGIPKAKIGAPGAVEHAYRRSGDVSVTLARSFGVSVQIPGGDTLELGELLTNTSEPYALEIGEVQSVVTRVR